MYRFWNHVIHPFILQIQPNSIVEIGAADGKNTKNILEYCTSHAAVLHAIDPCPTFDTEQWKQKYGDALTIHNDLSLNILETLPIIDVVLIDGDHNWYTVYHELLLLEKYAKKTGSFPLVFLHDVGWPYGRRDMYYHPEHIPVAFRHAYEKKGILSSSKKLGCDGFNTHAYNAVYENSIRNGVKTAIEDFLQQSSLQLEYKEIQGMHGLGIIMTAGHVTHLSSLLHNWSFSPTLAAHITAMDAEYSHNIQFCQKKSARLIVLERAHADVQESFILLREKNAKIQNVLSRANTQNTTLQKNIVQLETLLITEREQLTSLHEECKRLHEEYKRLHEEYKRLHEEYKRLHEENATVHATIAHLFRTKSWRITAPLRLLGSLISFLRH